MQIVIDIPNSLYANLQKIKNGSIACNRILDCVKNGTPLPKGHGDLIDRDAFDERIRVAGGMVEEELSDDFKDGVLTVLEMLKTQPTVVPADKEVDDEGR